jgi:hypothetical protein
MITIPGEGFAGFIFDFLIVYLRENTGSVTVSLNGIINGVLIGFGPGDGG